MDDEGIYERLKNAPGIDASSRESYANRLRRVHKICITYFGDPNLSITKILLQPTNTLAAIKNESSDFSVQANLIQALLAVIKHVGPHLILPEQGPTLEQLHIKWGNIYTPINRGVEAVRTSGVPNEKEKQLPWSVVYDKNTSLRKQAYLTRTPQDTDDMILSDMYVLLEPRRVLDYTRLFIKKEKETLVPPNATGFINMYLKRPTIVITAFKTRKTEGEDWTKELPQQLVKDIRLSLEVKPREYLFLGVRGFPFTSSGTFSAFHKKHLGEWFGIPATPKTLRHSRATQVTVDPTISLRDKIKITKDMSHSLKTHMAYAYKPEREKDGSFKLSIFDPIKKKYVTYKCAAE
jgi:hypothetical protein